MVFVTLNSGGMNSLFTVMCTGECLLMSTVSAVNNTYCMVSLYVIMCTGECQSVSAVNNANVQHIYDLHILNNVMYYSEWNTSTISVLSLDNNGTHLQPLAAGLLRPSQFQFFTRSSTRGLTSPSK